MLDWFLIIILDKEDTTSLVFYHVFINVHMLPCNPAVCEAFINSAFMRLVEMEKQDDKN
jgi:hypothetical protein